MSEQDTTRGRQLVQRLSRAAAVLDKSLCGPPERRNADFDYVGHQKKLEQQARQELIELREQLEALQLK